MVVDCEGPGWEVSGCLNFTSWALCIQKLIVGAGASTSCFAGVFSGLFSFRSLRGEEASLVLSFCGRLRQDSSVGFAKGAKCSSSFAVLDECDAPKSGEEALEVWSSLVPLATGFGELATSPTSTFVSVWALSSTTVFASAASSAHLNFVSPASRGDGLETLSFEGLEEIEGVSEG